MIFFNKNPPHGRYSKVKKRMKLKFIPQHGSFFIIFICIIALFFLLLPVQRLYAYQDIEKTPDDVYALVLKILKFPRN